MFRLNVLHFLLSGINKLERDFFNGQFYHLIATWETTWQPFHPISPQARAKMAGIVNKVYWGIRTRETGRPLTNVIVIILVCVIKWWRVKLANNFTSIPFDYLLISWVTNYVSNLGFLTCLSRIVSIENSTLSND